MPGRIRTREHLSLIVGINTMGYCNRIFIYGGPTSLFVILFGWGWEDPPVYLSPTLLFFQDTNPFSSSFFSFSPPLLKTFLFLPQHWEKRTSQI